MRGIDVCAPIQAPMAAEPTNDESARKVSDAKASVHSTRNG